MYPGAVNNLAALNGKPREIRLDDTGEIVQVHPLNLADMGDLQLWVDKQIPNPFDGIQGVLRDPQVPIEAKQYAIKIATDTYTRRKPPIGTPEADAILQTMPAVMYLLYLSLRKGKPNITEAEAKSIYARMRMDQVAEVFNATGMIQPGDGSDPKGGAETLAMAMVPSPSSP